MPADKTLLNQWMPVKIEDVTKLEKLKIMSVMDVIAILGVLTAISAAVMQYMSNERIPLSLDSKAWSGLLGNIIFFALFAVVSFGYDRQVLSLHIIILILSPFVVDWWRSRNASALEEWILLVIFGSGFIYFYFSFILKKFCNFNIRPEMFFDANNTMNLGKICQLSIYNLNFWIIIPVPFMILLALYAEAIDLLLSGLKNSMSRFLRSLLIMITCGIGLCIGWLMRLIFF